MNSKNWQDGDVPWATPRDLSKFDGIYLQNTERALTKQGLNKVSSGLSPVGSVLMSSRAPIGYVAIAGVPIAVNQGFIVVRPSDKMPSIFTKLWLETNMETIEASANGSTFLEVSKSNFRPLNVIQASAKVMEIFDSISLTWFNIIKQNEEENQTLAQTRDLLLPKLMSGDIRLSDAEALIPTEEEQSNVVLMPSLFGENILTPEQLEERDIVLIAAVVAALQKQDQAVGHVKSMKGVYLMYRYMNWHSERFVRGNLGPYCQRFNDEIRNKALGKDWIRKVQYKSNRYKDHLIDEIGAKYHQDVEPKLDEYGIRQAVVWLNNNFKDYNLEQMECISTVDASMQELARQGKKPSVAAIKNDIASTPQWVQKLEKSNFTDDKIRASIQKIKQIFDQS